MSTVLRADVAPDLSAGAVPARPRSASSFSQAFVRPAWCEIDLGAVMHNVREVRRLAGPAVSVFNCLKCDAFGCDAAAVGWAAERAGAAGLAFGNVDTALACRQAGIRLPMLLYPSCLPEAAPLLQRHCLMPTLSTFGDVGAWDAAAGGPLQVFLKVDAGGLRAGAFPRDVVAIAQAIAGSRNLALAGIYGHLLAYGLNDRRYAEQQFTAFQCAVAALEAADLAPALCMFASSENFLVRPEADFNAIDPGRLGLGMRFPAVASRSAQWRPALTAIKSRLVMCKALDADIDVLPAPFFPLRHGMRLGLIPLGWGDGYPRQLPARATALVRGQRVPLLGPVHAELTRIDLTDVPQAAVGDEVVLLGTSGSDVITLDELCSQWGMGELEVYSGIVHRLPKLYSE